jgi:hypothetical protein
LAGDELMKEFLEEKLSIAFDGVLHVNEIIAMAIIVVVILLIILIICDKAKKRRNRETTIFRHRKNRYKSRLGKKNKY